ncbi:MAG: DUF1990 domain-containing protein [Halobacteriales archaeon]|nr:DUF1990 domain-containing protein [Halobacteriales archaeon]
MAVDPCERWSRVAAHTIPEVPESTVSSARAGATAADFEAARDRLLRYDLYPRRVVASHVCAPGGVVVEGCTIAQWVRLGPFRYSCAVRVDELREGDAEGTRTLRLAYRTLEGHPERGRITFTVAWDAAAGRLEARVTHASRPALWWSRLGSPFARRLQARLNAGAARRLAGA